MSNPAISREDVHAYAEACSEMGMEFQTIAARLLKGQTRLKTLDTLLPIDEDFPNRAKGIEGRAQPHLLDEILWALYERNEEDRKKEETMLDDNQSAMIYLMLWTSVEALDGKWHQ